MIAVSSNNKGAVLLLVLGLLAILGMLGGVFLVTSRLSAKRASASAHSATPRLLARGAACSVVQLVKDDLPWGRCGQAYGGTHLDFGSGDLTKYAYIDYPNEKDSTSDKFLASPLPDDYADSAAKLEHLTNISSLLLADIEDISIHSPPANVILVDADGDGVGDAALTDTRVSAGRNVNYWQAVRVVDLGGKICVNSVSGSRPAKHNGKLTPASIGLCGVLAGDDAPFSIGEEPYLRWLGKSAVAKGRLANVGLSVDDRRRLTTYSCSRSVGRATRLNLGTGSKPLNLSYASGPRLSLADNSIALDTDAARQARQDLYLSLLHMLGTSVESAGYQIDKTPALVGTWHSVNNGKYADGGPDTATATYAFSDVAKGTYVLILVNSKDRVRSGTAPADMPSAASYYRVTVDDEEIARRTVNELTLRSSTSHNTVLCKVHVGSDPKTVKIDLSNSDFGRVYADTVILLKLKALDNDAASKKAAHFVANLWASMSPKGADNAFEFSPLGAAWSVYGVRDDLPYISEAYAACKPETSDDDDGDEEEDEEEGNEDDARSFAIELINPTEDPISLVDYTIRGLNGDTPIDDISLALDADGNAITIPAAAAGLPGRVVLYDDDHGANWVAASDTKILDAATIPNQDRVHHIDGLSEFANTANFTDASKGKLLLVRRIAGSDVPVDSLMIAGEIDDSTDDGCLNMQRDDNIAMGRYAVAKYKELTDGSHTLGASNDADDVECPRGVHIELDHDAPKSVADLWKLFVTGPEKDGTNLHDLPQQLADRFVSGGAAEENKRGKANLFEKSVAGDGYPAVPWPAMLGEIVEVLNTQPSPAGPVVLGRLNVNTASKAALRQLPWPDNIALRADSASDDDVVLEIRSSKTAIDALVNTITEGRPFFTSGGACMALANKIDDLLVTAANVDNDGPLITLEDLQARSDYLRAHHVLVANVANVISVRSDVFAVHIRIQEGDALQPKRMWRYLAVIDRSVCAKPADQPAVLLFTQIK